MVLFMAWVLGLGSLRDYLAKIYDFKSVTQQEAGNLNGAENSAQRSLRFRTNLMDPWNTLGALEDARAQAASSSIAREKKLFEGHRLFPKGH